jgi:hypothetical protein
MNGAEHTPKRGEARRKFAEYKANTSAFFLENYRAV